MTGQPSPSRRLEPSAIGSWALVVLGVAALAWRLVDLGNAVFINDEPLFLDAARTQLATGDVLTRSVIRGTSGYYYGGAIYWVYGLFHLVGLGAPLRAIGAMALLVTASQAFFAVALTRASLSLSTTRAVFEHRGRVVLGVMLLLLASSPHQHYWSRLAWDQLTNAVAFVVAGLVLRPGGSLAKHAAIGGLLGFGISSHPMIAPFAALAGLFAVIHELPPRPLPSLKRALVLGGSALLVMSPWLKELWAQRHQQPTFSEPAAFTLERALEVFRAPGVAGISYFFDGEWPRFLAAARPLAAWLIDPSAWVWAALGLSGLVLATLRAETRRLGVMGLACAVLYPVFYARGGIPVQPHYQFPTGWVALAGAAVWLARFPLASWRTRGATAFVVALAAWQLSFTRDWRAWVAERGGTRGTHFGVPVGEQQRVVDEVCAQSTGAATVQLQLVGFAHSFEYAASTTPACAGRPLQWCGASRGCRAPEPQDAVFVVGYAAPEGARLRVLRVK